MPYCMFNEIWWNKNAAFWYLFSNNLINNTVITIVEIMQIRDMDGIFL